MTVLANVPSQPQPTVATLRAGQEVEGVFACSRKERLISRVGAPYLTVALRDRTGTITARAFRDADLLAGCFERGDLVRVRGRVERFRDELQLALEAIERAAGSDADPAAFLPVAYRDLDELDGFLEHLVREVYDRSLKETLGSMLADEALRGEMRRAPCTLAPSGPGRFAHHAYLGGLLEHTVAVASMAVELCIVHPRLDRDLLLSAAIVHDLGKTREFAYGAEITLSEEGRMLGHIELGLRLLAEHVPSGMNAQRRLALEHCVITHHGSESQASQRFGSPEAAALQRLNALDAQVKASLEHRNNK
ncbi:MAG: HD domain-containing protein [Solirubrobacteraceae bacterium]